MSCGLIFSVPSSCLEGDSPLGALEVCIRNSYFKVSPAGRRLLAHSLSPLGGWNSVCCREEKPPRPLSAGGGRDGGSSLPLSFQHPPGSPTHLPGQMEIPTHTHLPIRFLFRSCPEKRGGTTSGSASLQAWLGALPGPSLGSYRGAAPVSTSHADVKRGVCCGEGQSQRWEPQSSPRPQLCRFLEKIVTFCCCAWLRAVHRVGVV